jgi:branched-chain amino acid transport system substrate-binding protein
LRNAAELAITDSATTELTVLVKDDHSGAEGARNAAQEAVNEGAELILGPLFAADVREVGSVARAANRPVIAFSTDTSVAGRNVYLLSFLIESYVDRIVEFAAQRGKKSLAALVPENDYGNVALAEFQAATARVGVRVLTIERYAPGGAGAAVQRVVALGDQIDALFIPEQAEGMVAVSQALAANNFNNQRVQLLGIGVWNDARILKLPALQGAWFAAPENAGFNSFAQRYKARFGAEPTRIATLCYDAVSLAAALARAQGQAGFSESVLTNPSGFNGADGVFRFRADGLNERGLSVLQIGSGGAMTLSPAPKSFGGGKS